MYDLSTIKRISKNDNAVICKYIQAFIKTTHEQLQEIDQLMAAGRWEEIAAVLHKMKTSVAYFFMNEIERKVIAAEKNIKNNIERDKIKGQVKEINWLLTEVCRSLQREIDSLSAS